MPAGSIVPVTEYNYLACKLLSIRSTIAKHSKQLAYELPVLPLLKFNDGSRTDIKIFANSFNIQRPLSYANNICQFYAEARDRMQNAVYFYFIE